VKTLSAVEKVKRKREREVIEAAEQQKSGDETTKLDPIVEEDPNSVEKSSLLPGEALLVGKNGEQAVPKRKVTIVDFYTNGAGDLSTTVGKPNLLFFACVFIPLHVNNAHNLPRRSSATCFNWDRIHLHGFV